MPYRLVVSVMVSALQKDKTTTRQETVSRPYSIIKLCSHFKGVLYVRIFYHVKAKQYLSWPQTKKTLMVCNFMQLNEKIR